MAAMAAAVTAAYMAIKKVVHVVGEMEAAYAKQNAAETKLTAALRATRGAVGYTTRELTGMASEMQRLTTIGDDEVISAQALMTTFTQIGHDVFPDAIKAAADMSVMFGQDLSQSSIQLGTALNDPIAGIGRLKRIGISFTEDQKASIQTFMDQNDIMGAQRIILDELTAEFGGVAEAMGNRTVSAAVDLTNATRDLKEQLGRMTTNGLAPARRAMAEWFREITEDITKANDLRDAVKGMIPGASAGTQERLDGARRNLALVTAEVARLTKEQESAGKAAETFAGRLANASMGAALGSATLTNAREKDLAAAKAQEAILSNTVIPGLMRELAVKTDLTGKTVELSEADKKVTEILNTLSATMATITLNQKDNIAGYDAEKERTAAVVTAMQALNATGLDNVTRKGQIIAAYGEYLPQLEQEAVLLGEATEAGETYLKNLLDIKFQIWALQDARAEAAEKAAAAEQSAALDTAGAWIGAFSDMAGANKKWIAFQKAAALAQIVFNTAVAVTEALKIPIYGEIKAAAIIAAGIGQSAAVLAQDVPQLAGGGIVNKPTLALIGENGPEAVVPLGKGGGGGRPVVVNINAGMVATQMQVENWVASIARRVV
jgi:hypothetical protein